MDLEEDIIEITGGKLMQSSINKDETGLDHSHQISFNHSSHHCPAPHSSYLSPQILNIYISGFFFEVEFLDELVESSEEGEFVVVKDELTALEIEVEGHRLEMSKTVLEQHAMQSCLRSEQIATLIVI